MSSALFKLFRDNLKVANAGDISTAYLNITTRLNKDFWDSDSEIKNSRQIGSYGRRTAIHGISDLDMAFELPWALYEKYHDYNGNGPSMLLQAVRTSLLKRYPRTEVRGDGQVVVIAFDKFVVEVLPVFIDTQAEGYRFPDSNNGGTWRICKPLQEMAAVDKRNADTNRNYKHVCKMVRAWKNAQGVSMSGMLIDTLVYNFFSQNTAYNDKSYGAYDTLFVSLFSYFANLEHRDYWMAPGSGQRVYSSGKFQAKSKKAAAKCQDAVNADMERKKAKLWREVFGRFFPAEVPTVVKSESAAFDTSRYTTEQFIEDLYPVDIRYDLDIDSDVIDSGTLADKLKRMAARFTWLPRGRALRFHIAHCDVPEPYELMWKVRNVGDEAERRKMIRGQIFSDRGRREQRESTDFHGEHYVEAYVIKEGVCVARADIDVRING